VGRKIFTWKQAVVSYYADISNKVDKIAAVSCSGVIVQFDKIVEVKIIGKNPENGGG
jgi:hypothetical protein